MYFVENVKYFNSLFTYIKSLISFLIIFNQSSDMTSIVYSIFCVFCALAWPFQFCFFANIVTDRIQCIGDTVYELDWYNYPPKMQRLFVVMIARSQRPVQFHGCNIVSCTLEMFWKVCF